ncbi:MAG: mechanosensitive ion channel [Pararhodobacter sp.]|nr:mechanosensitive ion channel [Pararhodobacter sp.]
MRAFFLALLLALPLIPAALPTGAETVPGLTDQGIAIDGAGAQDVRIRDRLVAVLAEVPALERIEVSVREGVVTLQGRALDADSHAALDQIARRLDGVVAVDNRVEVSTDLVERITPVLRRLQDQGRRFLTTLPLLGVAALIALLIGWAGFRLAALRWPWERIAPNAFMADVLRQFVRLAAVLAGVVVALDILGARALLATFLGAAGILGLAVGFAVRDSVENFLASVLLSLRSPFRPNDLVEVAGDRGRVVRLTARATVLISPDGNQIRIPNATVFKARIINFSRQPERRFTLDVAVAAGADLARAIAVMREVLTQSPFVLSTPAPSVWLADVAGGTARITAAGWIDTREAGFDIARGETLRRMIEALRLAGIAMPGIEPASTTTVAERPENAASQAGAAAQAPADPGQEEAIEAIAEVEAHNPEQQQLLDQRTRDE